MSWHSSACKIGDNNLVQVQNDVLTGSATTRKSPQTHSICQSLQHGRRLTRLKYQHTYGSLELCVLLFPLFIKPVAVQSFSLSLTRFADLHGSRDMALWYPEALVRLVGKLLHHWQRLWIVEATESKAGKRVLDSPPPKKRERNQNR